MATPAQLRAAFMAGARATFGGLEVIDRRYDSDRLLHNVACDGATLGAKAWHAWLEEYRAAPQPDGVTDAAFHRLCDTYC